MLDPAIPARARAGVDDHLAVGDVDHPVLGDAGLRVAWDVTTAQRPFATSPALGDSFPADVFVAPDGGRRYLLGSGNDKLYQFALTTPWDVTSMTPDGGQPIPFEPLGRAVSLRPDGARVYVGGNDTDAIHQRVLTTPWDVTTMAATDEAVLSVRPFMPTEAGVADFHLSPDGRTLHVSSRLEGVLQFELSTPWDLATATPVAGRLLPTWAQGENPRGVRLSDDTVFVMRPEEPTIETYRRAPCR